ncbi:MAG TPA: serine/threonine-protein kinase [Vicinamibacterales bacterium]|nr:serine/threonine-protein kinase [Vicinamibacterales bacterium]
MVESLGQYKILEAIGAGGVGDLYRARDTRTGRTVALDVVPPAVAADENRRARFLRSARALAKLSHPNIAALYEVGEDQGELFLAFEFVQGDRLKTVLTHGAMNARRALELAVQIGDALADAHGYGVLHGDLRPDNLVETTKGHAKILDFGLAQWTVGGPDRADRTGKSAAARTHAYASPEQKSGRPIDERSDIFSFGVVLFEMLTGRLPTDTSPPRASSINPELHQELDGILGRALAKNLDDRYSCAATIVAELLAVLAILNDRATRQRLSQ